MIVRIPKPFEGGVIFAGLPEVVMDYWYAKDKAVARDGLEYLAEQTVPIAMIGSLGAAARIMRKSSRSP